MSWIGERRKHARAAPSAEYAHKRAGRGTSPDDVAAVFVEIFLHGLVREPGPAR